MPGRLLLAACLALGCGSALDLERASRWLERPEAPTTVGSQEVPLDAPGSLSAFSGRLRAVALTWEPVLSGEVGGYVIERALSAEGPFDRIASVAGRFHTSFVDDGQDLAAKHRSDQAVTGLGDGELYHYRVRSFRRDGGLGASFSPSASGSTAPAPDRPESLRAYSHLPREVALSWRAVTEPTVAGYIVYRSPSAGGDYREIARIDHPFQTHYVDAGLGALRVFYYRVAAVNAGGGAGANTEPVRAVTKAPPLPPVEVRVVERSLGANRIAWRSNVESDVAHYRLLRLRAGSEHAQPVAEVPGDRTELVDREVGAGELLRYEVVAIDADGLESAPSDPITVESIGYGLRGRAEAGGVRLRWGPVPGAEFTELRVQRVGRLRSWELGRIQGSEFLDQDVKPGGRYRYRVVGVRPDGSEAPASRELEVPVPEAPASGGS